MTPVVEPSLLDAVKHNPTFFLLTIMVGSPSFVAGLAGLVSALRKGQHGRLLGVLSIGGAALALALSVAGWRLARASVEGAPSFPGLNDAEKTALADGGYAEALFTLWFGLGAAVPLLLLGAAAIVISRPTTSAD